MFDQNLIVGLIVLAVVVMGVYAYAPKVRAMLSGFGREGFADAAAAKANGAKPKAAAAPALIQAKHATAGGSAAALVSADGSKGGAAKAVPAALVAGKETFADYQSAGGADSLGSVPMAAAQKPGGCYPREQMNPLELLPADTNSQWAAANPAGSGDVQGKNFLSAGALIGVNTVGQSLRNANYQLRAEPPCPQQNVSPWMNSTIEPDLMRRPLE